MSKDVMVDVKCDKCGKPIPWSSDKWQKKSFLWGKIIIQRASSAKSTYKEATNNKYLEYFELSEETDGQKLVLEYGKESDYDLCFSCRDLLIETLGKFFNTKI